jgi:tubby-related protein 1
MIMNNLERPSRPNTASQRAPDIDVLSAEVEEMELHEQQQQRQAAQLAQQRAQLQSSQEATPAAQSLYGHNYLDAPSGPGSPGGADALDITDDAGPVGTTHGATSSGAGASSCTTAHPSSSSSQSGGGGGGGGGGDSPPQQRQSSALSVPRSVEVAPAVIDTSDLRAFLLRPGPQGAMVQCYIQRRKSGLSRLYPTYEVYLKDGEQFLLAARRRKKQKQSNYKVSLDREDLSRHSSNYFGKLKSNFMGTEFQMYDQGVNPEKLTDAQKDGSNSQVRQELATVLYKQNVLGSRGPRKMKVIVPNVDENGNRVALRPVKEEDTMLERYKAAKGDENVQVLKNKQPKWNDQVGAYVLNFNGRVTRASVKNFQLCNVARDPDLVVMQFGRVGKDAFTMDYQWPLCGLQAFGIALSSFDYKIACE